MIQWKILLRGDILSYMSETALYRKYRPQNFDEVFGQEPIVDTLKKTINLGNFYHSDILGVLYAKDVL